MKNFHLTINGKRYAVAVERVSGSGELDITIDGQTHRVQVEAEAAAKPAAPVPPTPSPVREQTPHSAGGGGKIVAPLPGVVLSINVAAGDAVRAGDALLVLEAMKMENTIPADMDGAVKAVHVAKGEKVEAGQLLMEIS